jgi:DNA-directed RNA polymerase subunit M/transcription elongation factor TFIIS
MVDDDDIPECLECQSAEVVVHKHTVATSADTVRKSVVSYECVECGRQWQPITELTGQTLKPIRLYS